MAGRSPKVSDAELVNHILQDDDPFITAKELSEKLPMSRQGINNRLNDLEESGVLEKKSTGSGMGWWVSSDHDSSFSDAAKKA